MVVRATAVCILGFGCAAAAMGDIGALRCEGRIVDRGASLAYVLALCGEPLSHIVRNVPVRSRGIGGFSRVVGFSVSDDLIYDRGWGRFPALLEFVDGRLRRIEYLPR